MIETILFDQQSSDMASKRLHNLQILFAIIFLVIAKTLLFGRSNSFAMPWYIMPPFQTSCYRLLEILPHGHAESFKEIWSYLS